MTDLSPLQGGGWREVPGGVAFLMASFRAQSRNALTIMRTPFDYAQGDVIIIKRNIVPNHVMSSVVETSLP